MPNTIKTISLTDDDKCYLNKLLDQSILEIHKSSDFVIFFEEA